ncbi:protein of unknown function [Xenorhabdus doucetiae]|uniref:Uncharacterized protein n=1 Tax=Xenorhabdus doucetiae TaxID=351671 RepID=A0A068QU54_9GAMM|nr:protein of unknown function [Xenorhabdus doucetiae]
MNMVSRKYHIEQYVIFNFLWNFYKLARRYGVPYSEPTTIAEVLKWTERKILGGVFCQIQI